jgi:hypothetical protein
MTFTLFLERYRSVRGQWEARVTATFVTIPGLLETRERKHYAFENL